LSAPERPPPRRRRGGKSRARETGRCQGSSWLGGGRERQRGHSDERALGRSRSPAQDQVTAMASGEARDRGRHATKICQSLTVQKRKSMFTNDDTEPNRSLKFTRRTEVNSKFPNKRLMQLEK